MLLSLNNYELYPAGTWVLLVIDTNKIDIDETSFKRKKNLSCDNVSKRLDKAAEIRESIRKLF